MKTITTPRALLFSSALFIIAVDLIFSGSAFRIDDSLFLWTAKRILNAPFDPFSFDVNWYGYTQKMTTVVQNPPFASYYQAVIALVFGFSETSLHLGFILPTVICLYATYNLSWRLGGDGGMSVLLLVSCPVFLLCSTVVMSDMWMTCFWCLAARFWVQGVQEGKPCELAAGAFFSGMAALSKFYGLACPILLAAYVLCQKKRKPQRLGHLVIPTLMITFWSYYSKELYGTSQISQAISYGLNAFHIEALAGKLFVTTSFIGGCTLFPVLLLFADNKKRYSFSSWGSIAVLFLVAGLWAVRLHIFHKDLSELQIIQFVLFGTIGTVILCGIVRLVIKEKSPENIFILLWMFGTVIFVVFFNWTVAGRNILPLAPVCAILTSKIFKRRSQLRKPPIYKKVRTSIILTLTLVTATVFTWADSFSANNIRKSAQEIVGYSRKQPATVWFQGHWGFQYYMENLGAVPVDYAKKEQLRGDLLVIPVQNTNITIPDKKNSSAQLIKILKQRNRTNISTLGFYSSLYCPVPFTVTPGLKDIYLIYRVQ